MRLIQTGRRLLTGLAWLLASAPVVADPILNDNPLELIGSKMNFRGTVVKKACELAIGSEDQTVLLRAVDVKNLYQHGWGLKQPFEVKLQNCDTAILNDVVITFKGNEDAELPGRLRVSGADSVAIALFAQVNGDAFLPLSVPSVAQSLSQNDNILRFQARIEAHPSAMSNKSITVGPFQAVAYFGLEYQ